MLPTSQRRVDWLRLVLLPALFYFLCFCIFTFPLITTFSTAIWGDKTDAMQSAWNLWWVRKAVLDLHTSPWYTNYVYYPVGVSLLPHDLNAANTFVGIILQSFLSLQQVYNLIVLVGFVGAGLTMYWLAYYLTKSYIASLLSGFIFTFSSYHFAHLLSGHLTVVSLEGIPLFVLCWLLLLKQPTFLKAIVTAVILAVIAYTSLYFFLYCVMIGAAIAGWFVLFRRTEFPIFSRPYILRLGLFAVLNAVLIAPLVLPLLILSRQDPIVANHITSLFSMDIVSLFIPGSGWRFASLTQSHWSNLIGNSDEHSIFLGIVAIIMLIYAWIRRRDLRGQYINMWFALLLVFVILSLGPVLKIWGHDINLPITPYSILERVIPPLRSSGVPVRMDVLTDLCAALIGALAFALILKERKARYWLAAIMLLVMFIDYFPRPVPVVELSSPPYVDALKNLPAKGGVLDTVATDSETMFRQMVHDKPVALGYVSRFTVTGIKRRQALLKLMDSHAYDQICKDYDMGYLVAAPDSNIEAQIPGGKTVYNGADAIIYEMNCP